jgi:hypothetical protein
MARLYADENFPLGAVVELRHLGHDVLTALEAGQANQRIPDPDVLLFAIGSGRAVLTLNWWHFVGLHTRTTSHCGIVVCQDDRNGARLAARIDQAVTAAVPLDNKLVRVRKPSAP